MLVNLNMHFFNITQISYSHIFPYSFSSGENKYYITHVLLLQHLWHVHSKNSRVYGNSTSASQGCLAFISFVRLINLNMESSSGMDLSLIAPSGFPLSTYLQKVDCAVYIADPPPPLPLPLPLRSTMIVWISYWICAQADRWWVLQSHIWCDFVVRFDYGSNLTDITDLNLY